MKTLKNQNDQYRVIKGVLYRVFTSNPASFADEKKIAKAQGLKTRIIDGQLYKEKK